MSTGSREGAAWAGLKIAGRGHWGSAHAQPHRDGTTLSPAFATFIVLPLCRLNQVELRRTD